MSDAVFIDADGKVKMRITTEGGTEMDGLVFRDETDGLVKMRVSMDGGPVSVTSDDITDATAVGKAVLTASDEAAARTAIGAGTSNQNLQNMTLQEAQEGVLPTARAISPQVLRASMPNLSSVAMLDPGATLEDVINKVNEVISTISP